LDEHGGVDAFRWHTEGKRGEVPIEKGLLFRTTTARGPNGRSALRNAFRPYQFKKRLEELVTIGVDRDLNGLPHMRIPADVMLADGDEFRMWKEFVTRIKRDELWGAVTALEYDENGNSLYEFEIMNSGAHASLSATKDLIVMFAQAIAGVVLADFVRLGRDSPGSRALAEPKQQLFQKALQGWVDAMAEVLNRHAVPRLFALNNFNLDALPRFVPEEVEDTALEDLGRFILSTSQAGMDWGFLDDADPIQNQLRQLAGFDSAPDGLSKQLVFDSMFKTKD